MGYLSCKSHLAVATCDSHEPAAPDSLPAQKPKKKSCAAVDPSAAALPGRNLNIKQFDYSDLEAATGGFSSQKLLGRGSHGSVYKGVLHNGRLVAVKRSSSSRPLSAAAAACSTPARVEVENEIDILSQIRSPRLVNLVGFTTSGDNNDRLLVVEFMKNGTLFDVLHSSPNPPGWGRRLRLALQTAKAIHTLHSSEPPVVHRDIKSANVLIDRHFNARLGDFGLALRYGGAGGGARFRSTPPAGTLGYLDPCYVTPDNLSTKTDVFSFGILLLEIISGRKAIDVAHSPPYILDWAIPLIKKGKIMSVYDPRVGPPKDPVARKQIPLLAAKCLRSCRDLRPSMKEVVECLAALSRSSPLQLHNLLNINNPCIAAEDVGQPAKFVARPMRVRSASAKNLMDLLKDDDSGEDEADATCVRRSSSCRSTRSLTRDRGRIGLVD